MNLCMKCGEAFASHSHLLQHIPACPQMAGDEETEQFLNKAHQANARRVKTLELAIHHEVVVNDLRRRRQNSRIKPWTPEHEEIAAARARPSAVAMWAAAGGGIGHKAPAIYLQTVIWRMGEVESDLDLRTTNVPVPESRPAQLLMDAKIDVEPERYLESSRGQPRLTEIVMEIEESRHVAALADEQQVAASTGGKHTT